MTIIKCKISDEHFSGFETTVDLDYVDSFEEICELVKKTLCTHLEQYKFDVLIDRANEKKFHVHDLEFGEILINPPEILWICNHCKEHNDENTTLNRK